MTTDNIEHVVDRTGWPAGEWDNEPDREEWRAHGFPCLIVRAGPTGALCGYVGLPPGHPLHGKTYGDDDVHGGITYGDTCREAICHVPREGEPAEVWWLGFDCAHSSDTKPVSNGGFEAMNMFSELFSGGSSVSGGYKSVAYVRAETEQLAEQLRALA